MISKNKKQSGFLLIEALIALSLLGVSALSILTLGWQSELAFREHLKMTHSYFLSIESQTHIDETQL